MIYWMIASLVVCMSVMVPAGRNGRRHRLAYSSSRVAPGLRQAIYRLHQPGLAAIAAARPSLFEPIRGIVRATDSLRHTARNT
jgi:hypothetical protein